MEACKTTLRQLLIHNAWTRTVTEVWVQEKTLPDYGCYVWPSAMVLVLWLARRQGDLLPGITDEKVVASPRILELGSGVGLVGLYLAKAWPNCFVTLSDSSRLSPLVLSNLHQSADINNINQMQVKILDLHWGLDRIDESFDLIFGADVFYDPQHFYDLLSTVDELFKRNPRCCFITSYQERSSKRSLTPLLEHFKFKGELIDTTDLFLTEGILEAIQSDIIMKTGKSRDSMKQIDYEDASAASVFLFKISRDYD
jgi:predicted nicotinamide N-methyase